MSGFLTGAPATWLVPTSHFGSSDVLLTLSLALQIQICRMEGIIVPDLSPPKKASKSVSSSGDVEYANSFRVQKKTRPDCFVSEEDDAWHRRGRQL